MARSTHARLLAERAAAVEMTGVHPEELEIESPQDVLMRSTARGLSLNAPDRLAGARI